MQYIGRLMRDVDPEPLHAALAAWARGSQAERAQFALVESWRDRMLQESDGINAFADAYPGAPRESLASLAAAARDERARGAPPHKSRELFRALKRIIEGTPR
jgi:ribosome-associated protein